MCVSLDYDDLYAGRRSDHEFIRWRQQSLSMKNRLERNFMFIANSKEEENS